MTKITDSNRFGGLSSSKLKEFEIQYTMTLLKEYRDFLLEHNGGEPKPSTNKTPETDVQWIYGIHDGEYRASLKYHINSVRTRLTPRSSYNISEL